MLEVTYTSATRASYILAMKTKAFRVLNKGLSSPCLLRYPQETYHQGKSPISSERSKWLEDIQDMRPF